MALPVLDKTWQIAPNVAVSGGSGGNGTFQRNCLRMLKNAIVSLGTWSVWYSAQEGTLAAFGLVGTPGDGVDYWVVDADVGWSVFAWTVLRNSLNGIQIMIGTTVSAGQTVLKISPSAGFTGGTSGRITVNNGSYPVATDEMAISPNTGDSSVVTALGMDGTPVGTAGVVDVWQSSDGQILRYMLLSGGTFSNTRGMGFLCEYIKNPTWNPGIIGGIGGGGDGVSTNVALFNTWDCGNNHPNAINQCRPRGFLADNFSGGFTAESISSGASVATIGGTITVANDITLNFPLCPIGFASIVPGFRGRHGQVYDLWAGSGGVPLGSTYPNDATRQLVQFYNFVYAWDGSIPLIT